MDHTHIHHQVNLNSEWLLRSAVANSSSTGSIAFPSHFGAGSKLNSIDIAYLKDLELSSTAESQAPSTLPPNNKEIESCTSFEYHDNGAIKSPFQREIQRLLDSSISRIPVPINRNGVSTSTKDSSNTRINTNVADILHKANKSNGLIRLKKKCDGTNVTENEFEAMNKPNSYMQVMLGAGSAPIATVNGKHPVGLEAIKEIAKNTTTSDSSHM